MFATCSWWRQFSQSPWSCRRPLRAPLESELLVFIRITTSSQVRTWIVGTLIAHTQETFRITDLDTFGDVRSTRRNKTVCCFFFSCARLHVQGAVANRVSEERTARRTRSMICIRSEATPRTLHRRAPELQSSRHRVTG